MDRKQKYEKNKREGRVLGSRFTDAQIDRVDSLLPEGTSRSAWLNDLVLREIGWNTPAPKKRKR
jgi:hypothetical protein